MNIGQIKDGIVLDHITAGKSIDINLLLSSQSQDNNQCDKQLINKKLIDAFFDIALLERTVMQKQFSINTPPGKV